MDEQTWSLGGNSLDENHEGGLDGGHGGEGEELKWLKRSGRDQRGSEVLGGSPHPNGSVGYRGEEEVVLKLGRWGCLLCQARPSPDTYFFSEKSLQPEEQSLAFEQGTFWAGGGGSGSHGDPGSQ